MVWLIYRVGYTALIAQLILGFALMAAASPCPVWLAAGFEALLFAAAVFCLIVKDAAREAVAHSEAAIADNTAAWKAIRARAVAIAAAKNHPELRKLAEEIRFADPTPTSLDGQIAEMLETLSSYADVANIKKAFQLLDQRKAIAKQHK